MDDVTRQLDEIGWVREHTTVLDRLGRYVLIRYSDGREVPRWVIVDLDDGRRVAEYGTDYAGRDAFTVFVRRA